MWIVSVSLEVRRKAKMCAEIKIFSLQLNSGNKTFLVESIL